MPNTTDVKSITTLNNILCLRQKSMLLTVLHVGIPNHIIIYITAVEGGSTIIISIMRLDRTGIMMNLKCFFLKFEMQLIFK